MESSERWSLAASAVSGGGTHMQQPRRKSIYSPDVEEIITFQ